MGLVLFVYLLSAITQTTNKRVIYKLQVYITILRDSDPNDDNNINYKNYLHRGLCILCGKMSHMENLDQSQNQF